MITGEVKNKLDRLWDAMWSNQMTNPWIDIQQVTYLIFIKMLDDNQRRQEAKINDMISHGIPVPPDAKKDFIFKDGNYVDQDERINVPYESLRWSRFKEWTDSNKVFSNLRDNVFPFIKKLNSDKATAFAGFMKDAQFAVSNAYILNKMINSLSDETLGFNDKDLMGDCYEYLLSKMATSGDNGQFRTPRHIIDMMVELAKPTPKSVIIDPAMGTAGFLAESAKYIQEHYENELMKDSVSNHFLGVIEETDKFKASFYDAKPVELTPVQEVSSEEVEVDSESLSKYKESIDDSIELKATQDITEAETRKLYIDEALKEAGWKVHDINGVVVPGIACTEIVLEGMPNNSDEGRADYILFDDDGMPLAVVEAKKTSVDPVKGYHQAKLYADAIESKWGRRPIIFTTNGYIVNIVDNQGYPERRIFGFYTKNELKFLFNKQPSSDVVNAHIDQTISDRPFIQEAVTSVCESFEKRRRKALVVMATGTGKTRFAISLVDVLNKYGRAKHVLFLADRTALVNQAKANFIKFLPSNTVCVLSEENEADRDYDAQVTLSTYQTLINTIDGDNRKYGIGHFDLIILDECHRTIYNKYRAIFNYFDSLLLGLTATPKEFDELLTTYDIFDLPKGEPTYSYDYQTAVNEGFLVDFHVFDRTTNLLKNGLKYDKLPDDEKEEYENLFSDEEGNLPAEIHQFTI